jgi:hypothetical protein
MYDTFRDYGSKVELRDQIQLDTLHDEVAIVKVRLEEVYDWLASQHTDMVGGLYLSVVGGTGNALLLDPGPNISLKPLC